MLFAYWIIPHVFFPSADFFQNHRFQKILSGISLVCQTVWILIRPDKMSGLIWIQTVCSRYQQTTLVGKELVYEVLLFHKTQYQKAFYPYSANHKTADDIFGCGLLTFFKIFIFQKTLFGTPPECQTVWIQIRTDRLLVLIWVQTVKGYQQMTKVAAEQGKS